MVIMIKMQIMVKLLYLCDRLFYSAKVLYG